jgi:hypothetical protein
LFQLYTHLHPRSQPPPPQPGPKMVHADAPASSSRFTPSPCSTLASRRGHKLDPSH